MRLISLLEKALNEARVVRPEKQHGTCVILLGATGAGKSTVTKYGLVDLPNIKVVNSDAWIHALAHRDGADLRDAGTVEKLHKSIKAPHGRHRDRLLDHPTKNLVIETTGNPVTAGKLVAKLREAGWYIVIVLVRVSLDTALAGNANRDRVVPDAVRTSHDRVGETFDLTMGSADEAWIINNDKRPSFEDIRSSLFITRVR